jgi:hypothetical protein
LQPPVGWIDPLSTLLVHYPSRCDVTLALPNHDLDTPSKTSTEESYGATPTTGMVAVILYAYKGKPLVDAAVKAIAQTSNYLHAMSCLFTNAAIQYK